MTINHRDTAAAATAVTAATSTAAIVSRFTLDGRRTEMHGNQSATKMDTRVEHCAQNRARICYVNKTNAEAYKFPLAYERV